MTRIKICGINERSQAMAAVEAGSDFNGLVFAPSRRQVGLENAKRIVEVIKQLNCTVKVVGVFVNSPAKLVNSIASACNLDYVQLSGDELPEYCYQIDRPIIKEARIGMAQELNKIFCFFRSMERALSKKRHIILLDSLVTDHFGGTGQIADWDLYREIAGRFPVMIAGGLTPENVGRAIDMVAPWGVDVSSGVEINGKKDNIRIRAFIEEARRADETRKHPVA